VIVNQSPGRQNSGVWAIWAFCRQGTEGELAQRHEQQLRQRLKAAAFPYQKRLEDFDFSLVPSLSKIRLLELAQGPSWQLTTISCTLARVGLGKRIY
jgi:DNA replication protein DnaC